MTSTRNQRAVGIFPDRPTTASALQALQDARFSRRHITVIARDAQHQSAIAGVPVHSHISNRAGQGAAAGAFTLGLVGGAAGLATGLGLLTIPGLAPLLGLAPSVLVGESTGVLGALAGTLIGATTGGLVGALVGLGIPANRARQYRDRVERGEYLVLLNGTQSDIQRAESLLQQQGIQDLGIYEMPADIERSLEDPISAQAVHTGRSDQAATVLQIDPIDDSLSVAQPLHPIETPPPPTLPRVPNPLPPGLPLRDAPPRVAYPEKRLIGTFATAPLMEQALNALKNARFPMHKISLVVRDGETIPQLEEHSTAMPGGSTPPQTGTGLRGITDLMVGVHRLTIPGQGHFLVIGGDVAALTRTQTAQTPADLVHALIHLGISETDARLYGDRLSHGASLIMIRGVGGETLHATSILSQQGLQDWCIYDVRDAAAARGLN